MSLHYSCYNYEVTLSDGSKGIYNLASKNKLVLQTPIKEFFEGILAFPDSKLARKWRKQGFLAEGDELTQLKLWTNTASANFQHLSLTIAPTTACNFRCPYCYEEHKPVVMSQEVQDKLVEMVQKHFTLFHPQVFSVTWYGGEPLLQPKVIENLSQRFIILCNENKVKYSANIVTNGYLLTQEIGDMLKECKVDGCQITLDGLKECNDRTRILADGSGSFDVITNNLRHLHLSFPVTIRCNLTEGNKKDFPELKKLIQKIAEQSGNKISCYCHPMEEGIVADKKLLTEKPVTADDFVETGDARRFFVDGSYDLCNCCANRSSAFVVAADGGLYKCWNDITVPERQVANLLKDVNPFAAQFQNETAQKYLDVTGVLEDEECRECQLLLVCKGGCPHQRVVRGQKKCLKPAAKNLDEYILREFVDGK